MSVFAARDEADRKAGEAELALAKAARNEDIDPRELAYLARKFADAHDRAEDLRAEARDPREA